MNIHPSVSAASAAGTAHAASKGGETDKQASEATARQNTQAAPGGQRPGTSAVDGGERLGDRGGDGRQLYDSFENTEQDERREPASEETEGEPGSDADRRTPPPAADGHLDLNA